MVWRGQRSSTIRNWLKSRARHALVHAVSLSIAATVPVSPAQALDPDRAIHQYTHTRWTTSEGAPAGVSRIVQTPDGYLWLASYEGLFRFDGLTFERIDLQPNSILQDYPTALLLGRDGELWAYYHLSKKFAVYRQGRIAFVAAPRPEGTVPAMAQTPNGDIWVAGGRPAQPILRFHDRKWSKVSPTRASDRDGATSMVVTADGALWVSYSSSLYRWPPKKAAFEKMLTNPGARMRLSLDPDGRVWVTEVGGSRPITEPGGRWTGRLSGYRYPGDNHARRGWPMFDRNGNLWIARRKDGLERLRKPSPTGLGNKAATLEEYRETDGLTSDAAYTVFEDREGSIWVGTTRGLDRFRDADVVSDGRLTKTAAYGDVLFADPDGNVYIGERNTVYLVRPHSQPIPWLSGVSEPEAICGGRGKSIWVVLSDHIAVVDGNRRLRLPRPAELRSSIKDCGLDRWGNMWLSADAEGLYRWNTTGWKNISEIESKPFRAGQMTFDREGNLWVNGGPGQIARLGRAGPTLTTYPSSAFLDEVRTIAPASDGLLIAGSRALGFIRRGKFTVLSLAQVGSLLGVNGVVSTRSGQTWLFTRDGLVRAITKDIDRAFDDPTYKVPRRVFGVLDGLIDSNAVRVSPSLVAGGDGRLWASTATGTVWIDPARLTFNALAPVVSIRSLEVDGKRFRDPGTLTLPRGSSSLIIGFAATGLRMPERVQVRYKLEGQDPVWINPGTRRQAFYTNLGPGTYRFRVIAANENGVWNRLGANVEFTVPPTFIQSVWFKIIVAALALAMLAIGYVVRLRQVTARLQNRFTIRIAERERIARELHDTLLQGFQGLLLQFKAIANKIPSEHATRHSLDAAVVRAQQVLIDGRNQVKDLRVLQANPDLAESLLQRAADHSVEGGPQVQLTQEGDPRPLHPLVAVEVQRIVEEALINALAHSKASTIDVMISWGQRELRLAVRDNGTGIPQAFAKEGGRDGHFGIIGMRERAERIGGELTINTRKSVGTDVALVVPGEAAYNGYAVRLRDKIMRFIRGDKLAVLRPPSAA